MPAMATGVLAGGTTALVAPPSGGQSSFPGTVAVWGTVGSVQLNAGFYDVNKATQFIPIGAPITAPGAVNVAVRCDILQIVQTGGGAGGFWVG